MIEYQKIQKIKNFLGSQSLWKADDHLLFVTQILFMRRYYRFFYNDIQGIIATRTSHFFAINVIMWGIFVIFGLFIPLGTINGGIIFFGTLFLLLALWNVISGRTIRITFITQVQDRTINGVIRYRKWNKLKKTLIHLIEEHQGKLINNDLPEDNSFSQIKSPTESEINDDIADNKKVQIPPGA